MLEYFGIGRQAPPVVSTDDIIPLHWFEDGFMWKKVVMYTLFVVNDALDAERLHTSLVKLIERPGYRKLGGRLRRNATGGIEYHVPREFSPDRPALTYSHVYHDMIASDHPIAAKIPESSNLKGPSVVIDPEDLSDLVRSGGKTLSLDDYLYTDRTTLGFHLTTFKDTTCMVLYWPHLAFDAMGKKEIIDSWILMLQGREDEILDPIGYDTDPLADFGKNATETHLLADQRIGNFGLAGYALKNLISLAELSGPNETRMAFIPKSFWEKMVTDVRAELADQSDNGEAPFFTEGDVIAAWWTRVCCCDIKSSSSTLVAAQNCLSLRKVLKDDLLPANRPFISMALGFPTVLVTATDLLTKPLSWVVLQFRKAINEQGTREQVESYAALQREFSATLRMPLLFGNTGMYNLFFSNWQKAGMFNYDWSVALLKPRESDKPLRPSYIQCVQDPSFPEGWPISGKDEHGNYWISGYRARGLWAGMERELEAQKQMFSKTDES